MLAAMSQTSSNPKLTPRLVVAGADRAIAFYVEVLGAREVERYADPNLGGKIVHAELSFGGTSFTLTEESPDWHNHGPTSLGGSPVLLTLEVDDADAVSARMQRAGATVLFPVADQFYGSREGRIRDPYGHVWILSQKIADVSREEIEKRMKEVSAAYLEKKR
jgi:PhnB protein